MIPEAEKLLDDFRTLPGRIERPRTFIEIAGYPHYENVCSNMLAFFMDPTESHGLGALVLDALANAASIAGIDEGIGGNISVEREVTTEKGNRIDILIESDARVVLIENKIFADASNNPFDDYAAHLDGMSDGREKHKFLLTISPTSKGGEWEFTNLTYDKFVDQIRSMLGYHVAEADNRYLTLFLDFLNTLENLKEGTRMNQEFLKLLSERDADIQGLLTEVKRFQDELRQKVKHLRDLIDVENYPNVKQGIWRQKPKLFDILHHTISLSENLPIAIETVVCPQGWGIQIFVRQGGDHLKLKDLLQSLDIPFEEGQSFVNPARFAYIHPKRFAYNENLDCIELLLQELIDKLATSQVREEAR